MRNNDSSNICGSKVREAREDKDWNQAELAAALAVDHNMELTQSDISEIERKERGVKDYELVALADLLEVEVEWLLR